MSEILDKELHAAIDASNSKQKKAVLDMVRVFSVKDKEITNHWDDKDFVAEMNDRYSEYKSGNAQLISLEDVEEKARKTAEKLKSKKVN